VEGGEEEQEGQGQASRYAHTSHSHLKLGQEGAKVDVGGGEGLLNVIMGGGVWVVLRLLSSAESVPAATAACQC